MNRLIDPPSERLKPRELEVLRLIAEGRSNQEIAAQLMIEVTTVRWHNRQIYGKLGVHSRTLLVARGRELGYLATANPHSLAPSLATGAGIASQASFESNLPAQTTSFIGREREIATARQLLATTRLLTLSGPGGAGKTRLAIELARVVSAEYPGGLCFVPLASVRDPSLLAGALAAHLKVAERTNESLEVSVAKHLSDKQMLLVIDNFEHLINGASFLATLLVAAPMFKLIVTSREVLRLYGEQEYPVPPLTMPDQVSTYSLQEVVNFEAVQLFLVRAQASQPTFQLTNANCRMVAEICARLDGLPLAIELAAARVKVLGAQQLLARLASRLGALSQGHRDAPARQRTLRATIEWSYKLLSAEEKALLSQVSVFHGGWTLEAMEAICAVDSPAHSQIDLFETLSGLVDKSLVQAAANFDGDSRFKMLETVREFALEYLAPAVSEATHRRHLAFFRQLAERGESGLETEAAQSWYERLRREEDNFHVALDWCRVQPQEAEAGLMLAGALWHYWHVRGIVWEGRRWLTLFLQRAEAGKSFARARALNGAGMLAYRQGEYHEVTRLCGEALEISHSLNQSERARSIAAFALHYLAHVAQAQGKMDEAEEMLARSMDLYGEVGNQWGYAETLNCLGDLQRQLGNYGKAVHLLEEALFLRRQLQDHRGIATTLHNLGHALCRQNESEAAAACFRESMEISQTLNNQPMRIISILGFAQIAAIEGKAERSARLLGAVTHLLDTVGYRLEPPERADHEWLLAYLHRFLDEKSFEARWREGASLTLAQAIATL